jgi:hypothetical protein
MAQQGNDNAKEGLAATHPVWNVHQGVYDGGTNATPLSMATSEDGDDVSEGGPNRDQRVIPGRTGWLYPDKPGIE